MLVITRKKGQSVQIGNDIFLSIIEVRGDRIRLGIDAPRDLTVLRQELGKRTREHNLRASRLPKQALEGLLPANGNAASPTVPNASLSSFQGQAETYILASGFWSGLQTICGETLGNVTCQRVDGPHWQDWLVPRSLLGALEVLLGHSLACQNSAQPAHFTVTFTTTGMLLELSDAQGHPLARIAQSLSTRLTRPTSAEFQTSVGN